MSTYVIGDVQGCQRELDALLRLTDFDAPIAPFRLAVPHSFH